MTQLAVLADPKLSALPGVRHAFFTRQGGVSMGLYSSLNVGLGSKDDSAAVLENRRRAAAHFGVERGGLLTGFQIHSSTVLSVAAPWGDARPEGDGVVTATPGLACGALAADCAPVLLADAQARVVCVVESAVAAMERLGARADRIVAAVGPCIGPDSYEVGPEFRERFVAEAAGSERFFRTGAGDKSMFDLPGFVLDRLARAGVRDAAWTGHDTYADAALFFSNRRAVHRGEADYGRLLSAIVLTG